MTREEAAKELLSERSDTAQAISDIGWQTDYWFSTAVTERLARRQAEEKARKLQELYDVNIAVTVQEQTRRMEAEARVKELLEEQEKLIWNLGGISAIACSRTLMEYNPEWARAALNDTYKLVADYVELQAKVKELEEEIKDLVTGLNHQLDETNVLRARVKELEHILVTHQLTPAVHPWACTCTACQNGETQKGEKQP